MKKSWAGNISPYEERNLEINKRKYKKSEVQAILDCCISEYDAKLNEQKARIVELIEQNTVLIDQLSRYKETEQKTLGVLNAAAEKADELNKQSDDAFNAEVLALKKFSVEWRTYFEYLKKTYPLYPAVQEAFEIKRDLENIFDAKGLKTSVEGLTKKLADINDGVKTAGFNPKSKIEDYISATSDNGFNLDEVLNPGKLELEDLCKELGLIDEQ